MVLKALPTHIFPLTASCLALGMTQGVLLACLSLSLGWANGFTPSIIARPLAAQGSLCGLPPRPYLTPLRSSDVRGRELGVTAGRANAAATPAATALNAGKTAAKGSSTRLGSIRVADDEVDRELQRERLMESLGATYMILWERDGEKFRVGQDFTTESRKKALRKVRGDKLTFSSASRKFTINANGRGPIATCAREGKQITIYDTSVMQRAQVAEEFNIKQITFVPVKGGNKVLEYGTPQAEEVLCLQLLGYVIQVYA